MDKLHKITLSSQMDGPDHKKMVLNMDDVTICTYHTITNYMTACTTIPLNNLQFSGKYLYRTF